MWGIGQFWRFWRGCLALGMAIALCCGCVAVLAIPPALAQIQSESPPAAESLEQQGKTLFDRGQYAAAAESLLSAVRRYETANDPVGQAIASSNLALVYEQLGQWPEANQAIASSLKLLQSQGEAADNRDTLPVLAQILDVRGRLFLRQGEAERALADWERAAELHQQLGNEAGALRSRINQAQALQSLGFYRRAIALLTELAHISPAQTDSLERVTGLRSLGDALRVAGDLTRSRQVLQRSLTMAQRLQLPEEIATTQLSLGNTAKAQGDADTALHLYERVAGSDISSATQTQTQLNRLSLLVDEHRWTEARTLWPDILAQLDRLPSSHNSVYARLNLVDTLSRLQQEKGASSPTPLDIAQLASEAVQQARTLGDRRAESFALGTLGKLYEDTQQWPLATDLTQQALLIAQANTADDIAYRWQWQLGRLFQTQGQPPQAIAAYTAAVDTLRNLRSDLVAVNPEIQFAFRDSIEPIHRQLVELLLEQQDGNPSSENLETARQVIESLQLAELDNFFRAACLNAQPILVDEVDRKAAVIYPILLEDRLAVIVSLPNQPLRYFSTSVPRAEVERTVDRLQLALAQRNSSRFLPLAQQLYDWLMRPEASAIATSGVDTLVFVPDDILRNIPMSVLHDGDRYTIETYGVALTPGLQLLASKPLESRQLSVLTAGLSEARQGFSPLPFVIPELNEIDAQVPSQLLLNSDFTSTSFQSAVNAQSFPIVHLATHGQFSSKLEDTFLLTWDDRIDIDRLRGLLQATDISRPNPVELLVLSACETAAGDTRAALGLAGVATRAGARSTLATLWQVNDAATAALMNRFYRELAVSNATRAEALRRAQLAVLQDPQYRGHPYYWAAYVLVGNWL